MTELTNSQLKLRLRTLLDKKRVMQSRSATTSKVSTTFITLEEGFQQFGNDLNKLQVTQSIYPLEWGELTAVSNSWKSTLRLSRRSSKRCAQGTIFSRSSSANWRQWDKTSKVQFSQLSIAQLRLTHVTVADQGALFISCC
jgi:hypothetical protein